MERIKRSERLGAMSAALIASPNKIHTLGTFCDMFGAAKSTISEDVELLRTSFAAFGQGELSTVAGAAGGVRYRATISMDRARAFLQALSKRLSDAGRLLPGGFLYTSDVSSEPDTAEMLGRILAMQYYDRSPDFVLTMETKGIPIAMMVARTLGVPLVIARRDSRAYEGSAVKINYIAGGSGERIETMALARRAVASGQRALIIDDFMKGGGTLRGMVDMMAEFQAEVVGVGVMIATAMPQKKQVEGAKSLMLLAQVDAQQGMVSVEPAEMFL
jgi:purine operon repressor